MGTAYSGSGGLLTLSMPTSFAGDLPVVAIAAITLAASIAEPPPTREDRVAAVGTDRRQAACEHVMGRVGHDAVEHRDVDALRFQRAPHRLDEPELHQHCVGHDHRPARDPSLPISRQSLAADPGPTNSTGRGIATSRERGFMRVLMRR